MNFLSIISPQMNLWQPLHIPGLKKSIDPADVETLRKQLDALSAAGVIKENEDLKPLPEEPIETINKQVRFCLDYQHFTQRTLPDMYSDRNIEKGLNFLVGNQFFSVLALVSKISQVPQFPGERENPYSVRPLGFYEKERMQPGYCESLASFQRLMEKTLSNLNRVEILAYQDYIIVVGKTYDEHLVRLKSVCKRLQVEGFSVSLEGSIICRKEVSYAGHKVCEAGISVDDSKLKVLSKWPKPRTVSELQCYVEFCSYYQQFISSFQDLSKPLTELLKDAADYKTRNPEGPWWTKESIEEKWTKACDEAFYQLKNGLLWSAVLPRANMTRCEAQQAKPKKKTQAPC